MTSATGVTLLIVRHAQTEQNRDGVVQGQADNPLSELGLRQAAALGDRLAGERLAAVYASPLQRAQATAAAVATPHGLPVLPAPGLIEMDIGEMEGLTGAELRLRFPEFLAAWTSERAGAAVMPGGESLDQVQARALAAVQAVLGEHMAGTIAVVTHNFVLLTLLCHFLGLPLHHFRRLRAHVASVSRIEFAGDRHRLVRFNDICHLEDAGVLGDDPWLRRR